MILLFPKKKNEVYYKFTTIMFDINKQTTQGDFMLTRNPSLLIEKIDIK